MSFSDSIDLGILDSTVLIFGGPYSNLPATSAMLLEAERRNIAPENIICSGDIVAYAAEPEQCSQLIRESGIQLVMGNCEESIAKGEADCGCGFDEDMVCSNLSLDWYPYVQSQVSDTTRDWMQGLPGVIRFSMAGHSCVVTHGSFSQINQFIFASTDPVIKKQELLKAQADIVIGGHCGLPFGQQIYNRLWLNAGVIGLPANDATVDGWYLVMEPQSKTVNTSWHRLQYDYQQCFESMQAAGLMGYANSIKSGLWPSMDILPDSERSQQGIALQPEAMKFSKF